MTAASRPLLQVEDLRVEFRVRRGFAVRPTILQAVRGVSFDIGPGETYVLVGESGSGKSTIGRAILQLVQPAAGRILLGGVDTSTFAGRVPLSFRTHARCGVPMTLLSIALALGWLLLAGYARW